MGAGRARVYGIEGKGASLSRGGIFAAATRTVGLFASRRYTQALPVDLHQKDPGVEQGQHVAGEDAGNEPPQADRALDQQGHAAQKP